MNGVRMEQNKTLLIIISVALFLAALLGVGLWLFYPRGKVPEAGPVASTSTTPSFDPIEWVRTQEDFPELKPKTEEPKEDVIILYGEKDTKKPETRPTPQPVPPRTEEAVPRETQKPAVRPAPAPTPAPTRAAPPAPSKPRTVTVTEYSIQVGSFSSLDKAEEAGQLLKEKGLAGQIVVRDVEGTRFYRLRIGPYENKAEAEKFLNWVKEIKGFEESMIFERRGTRTVAN